MTELFLLAHLAGRTVAIETAQVQSVVDIGDVVSVPGADRAVRGLSALRSRVVTVIDTRVALDLDDTRHDAGETGRRAIITVVDGHYYAVLVDALDDVAPFARTPLSSGLALGRHWDRVATGLIERQGEPVLILNLTMLIPQPPAQAA